MELLENTYVLVALTLGVFHAARILQKRTGFLWLNPILLSVMAIIAYLKVTGITFATYSNAGRTIEFWLQPAIVALGVPLYKNLHTIRQEIIPIVSSQLIGCIVGLVSCTFIAKWMGASDAVILSLAPKSVTTPIAMEVSKSLGGIPSLTAAIVVIVGLFGAIFGFKILQVGHIRRPKEQGLSLGAASHALGTSRAWEQGEVWGTYSSLGLILNGILTAILAPLLMELLL